jgi:DUF917 family protein
LKRGEIVKLFYEFHEEIEIGDSMREKVRNKAISDSIWGSIMSAMHDPSKITELQLATGKGFKMGNQIVDSLQNRQDVRSEYFQVGQKESIDRILEIEQSKGFVKWLTDFEAEEIKSSL